MPSKMSRVISLDEQTERILANSENASALVRRLLVAHDQGEHLVSAHRDALQRQTMHLKSVLHRIWGFCNYPETMAWRLKRIREYVEETIDVENQIQNLEE